MAKARKPVFGASDPKKPQGLARHFEGWQLGVLAVFLAGSSALVAVPRPVAPEDLPEPVVSPAALDAIARADERLADDIAANPLPFDTRELGRAFVEFGAAEAGHDDRALMQARQRIAELVRPAVAAGLPALLRLRAYQLRIFLRAVRSWERTGEQSVDLVETGGNFIKGSRARGWIEGDGRHLLLDRALLSTFFKMRWNQITSIQAPELEPTLDERRAFYRFELRNPPPPPRDDPGSKEARATRAFLVAQQYRQKKIDELAKIDPAYPTQLAKGVLYYWTHDYHRSLTAFQGYLETHPEGPYTIRAQNYLNAALEKATAEQSSQPR